MSQDVKLQCDDCWEFCCDHAAKCLQYKLNIIANRRFTASKCHDSNPIDSLYGSTMSALVPEIWRVGCCVVGGGVVGLAVAREIARRGHDTLVLEVIS